MKTTKEMTAITEIMYCGFPFTVLGSKEEPWFLASEVFKFLEIHKNHMARKLEKLDFDEVGVIELSKKQDSSVTKLVTERKQGSQNTMYVVSEPGFYKIALTSRTEKAKQFTRWVTHEVLPRIRKYGYYKLTIPERKRAAYKSIAEQLGLPGIGELDKEYGKMSLKQLEAFDNDLKNKEERKVAEEKEKAEKEAVREEWHKNYPYSYEEIDKLCDGDVEYLKTFIPAGEEDKYYKSITGSVYSERFSEKFKKAIPQFKKKAYCRIKI